MPRHLPLSWLVLLGLCLSACKACDSEQSAARLPNTETPAGDLTIPEDQNHLGLLGQVASETQKPKALSPVALRRLQTISERASQFPAASFDPKISKGLYLAHCARCHGQEGSGDGPEENSLAIAPTNLRLWPFKFGERVEDVVYTIIYGRSENVMPSFRKQLKEKEIWALAHLIRSWRPEPSESPAGAPKME